MNQKDPELVERFIALRARGVPYATIAAELGVGRTTLIRWSRTHAQRIANERAIEDELLSETLNNSRRAQLQKACALHDRIIEELSRRKLEDIPTDRLALLAFRLTRHLAPHAGGIKFSEPFTEAHLAAGDTPLLQSSHGKADPLWPFKRTCAAPTHSMFVRWKRRNIVATSSL